MRSAAVLGAAALLTVGLVGCSSDSEGSEEIDTATSTETRTFEAQNGSIEIPADPQRIVACGYAVLPLIQAGADLDYEAITMAEPDLIIMGVPAMVQEQLDMATLEALAPVVFLGPSIPGEWRELGEQFADAANVSDSYGEFKDEYDARAAELADKYAGTLGGLKFAGVCSECGTNPGEYMREYKSSYTSNLFDDLGFDFPGEPSDPAITHGEYLSFEKLPENLGDADVIVYGVEADGSVTPALQELFDSPLWKELPAVKAGNLVAVEHANAATYQTALLALDSIDAALEKLPANQSQQ